MENEFTCEPSDVLSAINIVTEGFALNSIPMNVRYNAAVNYVFSILINNGVYQEEVDEIFILLATTLDKGWARLKKGEISNDQ